MGYSLPIQLLGEFLGTLVMVTLGNGVISGHILNKSKAKGDGWVAISIGWGLAVMIGVYCVSYISPGLLNPAVTIGMAVAGSLEWSNVIPFIGAQILGAFCGAILVWLNYMPHWKETKDAEEIRTCFSTVPAIRHFPSNFLSEFIGTVILMFTVLAFSRSSFSAGLAPVVTGMLIMAVVFSMGGTTGYAINPARDLGPRIAHQILPIANKGTSDWSYSWVPVFAPICGAVVAALLFTALP
ncbi:MIP/aquaporin family protein [Lactobacillus terrae]|uniref:MIP/aquaporin family protein n=1 Tax=Lactobacillus terrae TaxID=2269374 RepID=UPI000C1B6574|nr:MIP/aquaporin family protein [Lactobacillus terrae]